MKEENHIYAAIDLKSFYASVECVDRGLDPMTTNLVVADVSRTEKTICLAVSPSLKAWGIGGRPRLFEVIEKVREINAQRLLCVKGHGFTGASCNDKELKAFPELSLDYITAVPQMEHYMECSTRIYEIYLKYIAPEDIHVYSIDEVFLDLTPYLKAYRVTARELVEKMIQDVFRTTGITATAGIGTNLYLCKVAMDILAKHAVPNQEGVRIAELDEMKYRQLLWDHRPLTDFWRVGHGYARKLEEKGLYTMGDIARCSLGRPNEYYNEELLYRLFGINAELLIDHAWGWEPVRIADIKAYRPESSSIGSGQVLQCPYSFEKGRLIVQEMADLLSLDLVDKGLVTDQMVLTIGYDTASLDDSLKRGAYKGEITVDRYGRRAPKHAHGTVNLECRTSSARLIMDAVTGLYERIVNKNLLVRRVAISANHVMTEQDARKGQVYEQLDLFADREAVKKRQEKEEAELEREKQMQKAVLDIKKKFGKNAVLRGMNLEDGAMARERNRQIGGHRA